MTLREARLSGKVFVSSIRSKVLVACASVVAVRSQRAAILHDFHRVIGALGLGLDQKELAVMEGDGVALDDLVSQIVICKMCLEGTNDGVWIGLCSESRLGAPPNHCRRIAGRKNNRPATASFLGHDAFVVNRLLKTDTRQFFDSPVQVPRIIKNSDYGRHW